MFWLLVAGLAVVFVGLVTVVSGVRIYEFSYGNTLIVAGTVAACTGAILITLSFVLRELKAIASHLASGNILPVTGVGSRGRSAPSPDRGPADTADSHAGHDDMSAPGAVRLPPTPGSLASPPDQGAAPIDPQPVKQRRNLMFMSTRREREAAAAAEPPQLDFDTQLEPAAAAEQPASFDDAWPAPDRSRGDPLPRPLLQMSAADADQVKIAAAPAPLRRPAESPPVTILKSGVVDGMAYSLYSDGSIEAQLPEGMIRFASIDELRSHLDHRE